MTHRNQYTEPFNPELHKHFIGMGYMRTRYEEYFQSHGCDPENGPSPDDFDYCPTYDEYRNAAEYVIVLADGSIETVQPRDIFSEQWIDSMYPHEEQ